MVSKDSPRFFGGLDLGATKILSLVVAAAGSVLAEDIRPTLGAEGPDAVIARMAASLHPRRPRPPRPARPPPRRGPGRAPRHMLFITVSSGIGGGIIIDGALYRGVSGGAGEVGHIILNEDGPPCGCGRRGWLGVYSSGPPPPRGAQ